MKTSKLIKKEVTVTDVNGYMFWLNEEGKPESTEMNKILIGSFDINSATRELMDFYGKEKAVVVKSAKTEKRLYQTSIEKFISVADDVTPIRKENE